MRLTVLTLGLWLAACVRPPYAADEPRRVIDLHTHVGAGVAPLAYEAFRSAGVVMAADLCGRPYGEGLLARLAQARELGAAHPEFELLVFAGIDWRGFGTPEYGASAVENLRQAKAAGAVGLKVFKSLGLGLRLNDGSLLAVDDPRLDPVWRAAGELGMPVAIHTGDPVAFFKPPTPENERWEELSAHPDWSFFGADFPSLEQLLAARDRMVARHPQTTFIAVHVGGFPENLAAVADSLRRSPNLWIDLAARLPEIGRQDPSEVRRFFLEFQDRILFGTDLQVSPGNFVLGSAGPHETHDAVDAARYYAVHWRYLETRARGIPHLTPIQGRWTIDGIGLPRAVLEKIYRGNALRLLGRG